MNKINIVALGSSNFQVIGGIREAFLDDKVNFTNLSMTGMGALSKIYLIKRTKNLKAINEADLIIIESNLIENTNGCTPVELSIRNTHWLFEELFFLKKKVLILILPFFKSERVDKTNAVYVNLAHKYGFNLINLQKYYEENEILDFWLDKIDFFHEIYSIMKQIGQNIVDNFHNFKFPRELEFKRQNPQFKIARVCEFDGEKEIIFKKSFFHNEEVVRLKNDKKLFFNKSFAGYKPLILSSCNIDKSNNTLNVFTTYSSLLFKSENDELVKPTGLIFEANEICKDFLIDENTYISYNFEGKNWSESSRSTHQQNKLVNTLPFIDMIDIFVGKDGKWEFEELNLDKLDTKEYDFNRLLPDINFYTIVIKEYNERKDPLKLAHLNNEISTLKANFESEISTLQNELNSLPTLKQKQELKNLSLDESIKKLEIKKLEKSLGMKLSKLEPKISLNLEESLKTSALARVKNHLAHKLGQAIIICNKSLFGLLSLPFVLSYIKAKHKKEQSAYEILIKQKPFMKLPKLETYADYEKALKEKECFTYKLGLAMMRADKTWYKGGYIKFYFEAKRLEREFRWKDKK